MATRQAVQLQPQTPTGAQVLTIRLRIQATTTTTGTTGIYDVLLQAGSTATGWVPHVTEIPWTAGITAGQ
jgi:hypothetical protein